jgi:hypothetical protein
VHVLGNSAAKLRRDAAESVEEVTRSSTTARYAVDSVYLEGPNLHRLGEGGVGEREA